MLSIPFIVHLWINAGNLTLDFTDGRSSPSFEVCIPCVPKKYLDFVGSSDVKLH